MSKSKQRRSFVPTTTPIKPVIDLKAAPAPSPLSSVPASTQPAVFGSDAAPVIYFDGVVAFGICNGVIQLELAANHLVPVSLDGTKVKVKHVIAVHLRCSPDTATNLMEVIEKMITKPPPMTRQ